jgi:hypothetical protein
VAYQVLILDVGVVEADGLQLLAAANGGTLDDTSTNCSSHND